ncbi:hypothetical protein PUN28_010638 [Cardiocondyla obscurior]|uniref:Uncharacterized protein n=1 Tax=Cardiocondyla obscurior TaxID=286306 RepID=A0AAW2FK59_9HYME
MNEGTREGPRGIALLDTRSLVEHAPKQNAPPAERSWLSSEKRREFRLRKRPRYDTDNTAGWNVPGRLDTADDGSLHIMCRYDTNNKATSQLSYPRITDPAVATVARSINLQCDFCMTIYCRR